MDSDSWIRIILLILLILGAAYCAASEISYASVNKIRMKNYADNGDDRAKKAMYISNNFDQALTTILIGNNLTHIGFASLATLISTQLWGIESVKYTTIVATVIVFLVSEMIPKSYAKANNVKIALAVSGSLSALMKVSSPIASLFMFIGHKLSKLFPEAQEPAITEEEFYDIIETAKEEGILDSGKQELVNSALDFDGITVGDILTVREDIVALDIDSTQEEILKKIRTQKYSRLPVYKGSIDNIIGILQVRKFLKLYIRHDVFDVRSLLLEPHFISKKAPIDDVLKEMSNKKLHISIVVDDLGKTLGVVTVEDILEELVGEIWDEEDVVNEKFIKLGGDRYEISGNLTVLDAFNRMGHECGNDETGKKTVSQWVREHLDGVPCEGSSFSYQNLEVSILHVDSGRITKVIMKLLPENL
ncbi:MAG: hemolysin family protein [Clostridiaceae bacterium]|nr:hemolysin family protein [Clostridiaceae bacterium]